MDTMLRPDNMPACCSRGLGELRLGGGAAAQLVWALPACVARLLAATSHSSFVVLNPLPPLCAG